MKFGTVCPKHCTTPFYQIEPAVKTPDVTPDTLASSGNQYYKNTTVTALVFRSIIDLKCIFFSVDVHQQGPNKKNDGTL